MGKYIFKNYSILYETSSLIFTQFISIFQYRLDYLVKMTIDIVYWDSFLTNLIKNFIFSPYIILQNLVKAYQ